MGGPAFAKGASFQARVIAYVYVHVLAESRLFWFEPLDDVPIAVEAETGGPGDDIGIEMRSGIKVEAQVKHGLTAGVAFSEAVKKAASRGTSSMPIRFVVDQSSSARLRNTIAEGLARLRDGRADPLPDELIVLRDEIGHGHALWRQLGVVQCDVDHEADPGAKNAHEMLVRVVADESKASVAWRILADDAAELAARRGRRDRVSLVALLKAARIEVRPLGPNARWHDSLEQSRRLIDARHFDAALHHLKELERELASKDVDARVLYRLHLQKAVAVYQLYDAAAAIDSARRALEHQSDGVGALRILTLASIDLGEPEEAIGYATTAVERHPDVEDGWIAMAEASVAVGRETPEPPAAVRASRAYRLTRASVAARQGHWQEALDLTDELMSESRREPQLLLIRAQALHNTAEQGAKDARARWLDAVRLLTELLDLIDDPANDLTRNALVVRAMANAALGEDEAAAADVATAMERYSSAPDVLRVAAMARGRRGDAAGALEVLRHPTVDQDPALLLLRAQAQAQSDKDAARRTLEDALAQLPPARRDPDFRVNAAFVALDVDEFDLARDLLADIPEPQARGQLMLARGKLAVAERRFSDAEREYREAAALKPALRRELLTVAALEIARAGGEADGVRILTELGEELPEDARDQYVRLLFAQGQFIQAEAAIKKALAIDRPPPWALGHAASLALRRQDLEGARRYLAALDERDELGATGRIRLAHVLAQLGRNDDARAHLDALRNEPDLTAIQLMEIAELLEMVGVADQGVPLAYRAARLLPNDPKVQRAFSRLGVMAGRNWPVPDAVAADTHVMLRNAAGKTRSFTILSDRPVEAQRGEMSVDQARERGLVGMKLGDEQVDNPGRGYLEERWSVVRISPAAVAAAHDVLEHFPERFPGEPFYVRAFQSTEGTITEFVPFIRAMEASRVHVTNLLTLYRAELLPLPVLAKWLNSSIADVVESIGRDPLAGQLQIEWSDAAGQDAARTAATKTDALVVTRSAIAIAQKLGLLDDLAKTYKLVLPASLLVELREELKDAERAVVEGKGRLVPAPGMGFALKDAPPGDAALVSRRDALVKLVDWAEKNGRAEPRPTETIGTAGTASEKLRQDFGSSTFDALDLVARQAAPLYADDLGLRRFVPPSASCSTITVLDALVTRGAIDAARRDELLLELALLGCTTIKPRAQVLTVALRRPSLSLSDVEGVFDLLAGPELALQEAASIGSEVLQASRTGLFQRFTTRDVTRMLLRSMAKRFRRTFAVIALQRAAEPKLQFFPDDLAQMNSECADALARSLNLTELSTT